MNALARCRQLGENSGSGTCEREMLDVRIRGYCVIAMVGSLVIGLFFAGQVDAKLFGRRRNGGGDGNVVSNAPVAPADLQPVAIPAAMPQDQYGMPSMQCTTGNCRFVMPSNAVVPTEVPAPVHSYPVAPRVVSSRSVVVDTVVARDTNVVDNRVDRIINALEEKLGLVPDPVVAGDATGLFGKLPKIKVELQNQQGEVVDTILIDTKKFVLRELAK